MSNNIGRWVRPLTSLNRALIADSFRGAFGYGGDARRRFASGQGPVGTVSNDKKGTQKSWKTKNTLTLITALIIAPPGAGKASNPSWTRSYAHGFPFHPASRTKTTRRGRLSQEPRYASRHAGKVRNVPESNAQAVGKLH
jgi:hypothetical protein